MLSGGFLYGRTLRHMRSLVSHDIWVGRTFPMRCPATTRKQEVDMSVARTQRSHSTLCQGMNRARALNVSEHSLLSVSVFDSSVCVFVCEVPREGSLWCSGNAFSGCIETVDLKLAQFESRFDCQSYADACDFFRRKIRLKKHHQLNLARVLFFRIPRPSRTRIFSSETPMH